MDQLLHYRISEELARSDTHITWLAVDTGNDRAVVLKQLLPERCTDPAWREAFDARIQTLVQLPATVHARVLSIEYEGGVSYVVREYVTGRTLAALAVREGVHYVQFLRMALSVCRSLQVWHDAGIVHGNLTSCNVMIEKNSQVVLLDSGLDVAESNPFRAPELAAGGQPTELSDLYGLGMSLFHLACGEEPSGAPDRDRLHELPSLTQLLITRLTSADPQERFRDVKSVIIAIEEMLHFRQEHPETEELPKQHRYTPRQYLLLSILAALLIILWLVITSIDR